MPLTLPEYQADTLAIVGLNSTDEELARRVVTWFKKHDTLPNNQAAIMVIRELIKVRRARLLAMPAATDADLNAIRAIRETLATIAKDNEMEYQRILAARPPLVGVITRTAPADVPAGYPNANAGRYSGRPYPSGTEDY